MQRRWRSTIVRQISRLNSAELLTDKETDGLMPMNETTWSARTDGIPWIYRRFVRSFQRGFRCGSLNYALPSGVTGTIRGAAAGPDINAGASILGPPEPIVSGYRIVIEVDASAWCQHEQP